MIIIIIVVITIPWLIFLYTAAGIVVTFFFLSADWCYVIFSNCIYSYSWAIATHICHFGSVIIYPVSFTIFVSVFAHIEAVSAGIYVITGQNDFCIIINFCVFDYQVRICPVAVNTIDKSGIIYSCVRIDIQSFDVYIFRGIVPVRTEVIFRSVRNCAKVIYYKFRTSCHKV